MCLKLSRIFSTTRKSPTKPGKLYLMLFSYISTIPYFRCRSLIHHIMILACIQSVFLIEIIGRMRTVANAGYLTTSMQNIQPEGSLYRSMPIRMPSFGNDETLIKTGNVSLVELAMQNSLSSNLPRFLPNAMRSHGHPGSVTMVDHAASLSHFNASGLFSLFQSFLAQCQPPCQPDELTLSTWCFSRSCREPGKYDRFQRNEFDVVCYV